MNAEEKLVQTFAGLVLLLATVVVADLVINGSLSSVIPACIIFYVALVFVNGVTAGAQKRRNKRR